MKELVSIRPLVQKAKDELRALSDSEIRLRRSHDEILQRAWALGECLCELKANVGRGNWLIWLPENLPELGGTDRARQANAARCMKFYTDNPPNCRKFCNYTPESKRKFMFGYVPKKERLQLAGNEKVSPADHYLTAVNNYLKWRRQVSLGRSELPPIDTMRHDFAPMVRDLIELLGPEWVF